MQHRSLVYILILLVFANSDLLFLFFLVMLLVDPVNVQRKTSYFQTTWLRSMNSSAQVGLFSLSIRAVVRSHNSGLDDRRRHIVHHLSKAVVVLIWQLGRPQIVEVSEAEKLNSSLTIVFVFIEIRHDL